MFGIDPIVLAIVVLAAVARPARALWRALFRGSRPRRRPASRVNRVKSAETDRVKVKAARDRVQEMSKRRKSVQDSLKDLEKRQQEKYQEERCR